VRSFGADGKKDWDRRPPRRDLFLQTEENHTAELKTERSADASRSWRLRQEPKQARGDRRREQEPGQDTSRPGEKSASGVATLRR
jgi:hypothetical protein